MCLLSVPKFSQVWSGFEKSVYVYPSQMSKLAEGKPTPTRILNGHRDKVQTLLETDNHVWSGDECGDIRIWSCETFDCIMDIKSAHTGPVFAMTTVSQEHNGLVEVWSSGKDSMIRIWDSEHYLCKKSLKCEDRVFSLVEVIVESSQEGNAAYALYDVGSSSKVEFESSGSISSVSRMCWTGSHSLEVWNALEKNVSNKIRLIRYDNGAKYVGEVLIGEKELISRDGRGELHYPRDLKLGTYPEIYVGHWSVDKRAGFGVLTFSNKDKYYGEFFNDQFEGFGVYVYNDGTVFEGNWKAGKRKGQGTLLSPNGDKFEGDWKDDDLTKGKYTKGTVAAAPRSTCELFSIQHEAALKVLREVTKSKRTFIPFSKWRYFVPKNVKIIKEAISKKYPDMKLSISNLSIMLNDANDPLGSIIHDFTYMFNASYHATMGETPTLLFHAIDDCHSLVNNMHLMIANLVPSIQARDCIQVVSSLLFSKIYPAIMSLFREVHKHEDTRFSIKITELRGVSLKQMGIKEKFYKVAPNTHVNEGKEEETNDEDSEGNLPFALVIRKLKQLGEYKTALKKVRCMIEASKSIAVCIDNIIKQKAKASDEQLALGAEDKFPILVWCIIKANMVDIRSQIEFIKEFAYPAVVREEGAYRLVEFEQAIVYIETLDFNIVDKDGVLTSLSSIEWAVLEALRTGRRQFEGVSSSWLVEILLICGSRKSGHALNMRASASDIEAGDDLLFLDSAAEYSSRCLNDKKYLDFANEVFEPIGVAICLLEDVNDFNGLQRVAVKFSFKFPQYVYTRLANSIEQEIKSF
eukprot:TRINITY_DN5635_c0_g1_i3.p1 TRINITY_DN5635_c0_g1~~TRINITY_DN5635_c0_g1_i3.p1  ORF type:complete len:804 (-),score=227.58 TRINITY_DN5635_c0_g1_i3:60-2471(-)